MGITRIAAALALALGACATPPAAAAKPLGITVPRPVLAQATEVIR